MNELLDELRKLGLMIADPTDWRHRAACRGADPDIWFPISTEGPSQSQVAYAKSFCERCPVTTECLNWALSIGVDYGVWGGHTAEERRAFRGRRDTLAP
jgi:WhiB family transcriptional regulator, redox-sensing transcriptional regulator